MAEEEPVKRWYVVHAYSGYENFVMQELKERIKREKVVDKFGEIMGPFGQQFE